MSGYLQVLKRQSSLLHLVQRTLACAFVGGIVVVAVADDSASPRRSPREEHNDHNNEQLCIRVVRVYEMEFSNQIQLITEANVSTTKPFCARFIQRV